MSNDLDFELPSEWSCDSSDHLKTDLSKWQPFSLFINGRAVWGPFHKIFCTGVKTPEGLRSILGVKSDPARREMNVRFSFIKEIHTGVEARQRGFDFYTSGNVSL